MLLVDDLAAGGTKNLRHTPRGLVTLFMCQYFFSEFGVQDFCKMVSIDISAERR